MPIFTPMWRGTADVGVASSPPSGTDLRVLAQIYQNDITESVTHSHKLIPTVAVCPDMTASLAALASTLPLQAGLLGTQAGQLLLALIVIALIIIVGKFVLKLAWRLVTIGIVVAAAFFLLSTLGLI